MYEGLARDNREPVHLAWTRLVVAWATLRSSSRIWERSIWALTILTTSPNHQLRPLIKALLKGQACEFIVGGSYKLSITSDNSCLLKLNVHCRLYQSLGACSKLPLDMPLVLTMQCCASVRCSWKIWRKFGCLAVCFATAKLKSADISHLHTYIWRSILNGLI